MPGTFSTAIEHQNDADISCVRLSRTLQVACPYAHKGERAARRPLQLHQYDAVICPDMHKVGT
jgi:hypothetical protein